MQGHGPAALAALVFVIAACNPFAQKRAVEISSGEGEVAYSSRWNATLATPSDLAGALQVKGSAWMAPSSDGNGTRVHVSISNAAPGGVHPWMVHQGRCGDDRGVVGQASDYQPLRVSAEGTASQDAILSIPEPKTGEYFVNVHASASNMGTSIACGNLAPPVR
ncbi:MAG TPA: hypothetical protein VF041_03820 [Gemmatimonadaceae bacterium]